MNLNDTEWLAKELYIRSGAPIEWEKLPKEFAIRVGFVKMAKFVQTLIRQEAVLEVELPKKRDLSKSGTALLACEDAEYNKAIDDCQNAINKANLKTISECVEIDEDMLLAHLYNEMLNDNLCSPFPEVSMCVAEKCVVAIKQHEADVIRLKK